MKTFQYFAKQGPGNTISGTIDANTYEEAVDGLILNGLTPIELKEQAQDKPQAKVREFPLLHRERKIRQNDVVLFTQQVSDLLSARIPLLKCLQIAAKQTPNKELASVVTEMEKAVHNGASFSSALSTVRIFPEFYVNMVRAGEMSGSLETVLARLAAYLDKEQDLMGKVKASLAYPLFVLIIGALTVFVLLTFVIPRLTVMFEDFDTSLPYVTVALMSASGFLSRFWWLLVALIIGTGHYSRSWINTAKGRAWADKKLLAAPLIGPFIKAVETERFARTLGTLVESGTPIVTALETVAPVVQNSLLKQGLSQAAEDVSHGASLGDALERMSFFPETAVNMISVGEETGQLENGLYKIADIYERQTERMMRTGIALLGPAVLTVVIAVIGLIVVAMLLPILSINELIT